MDALYKPKCSFFLPRVQKNKEQPVLFLSIEIALFLAITAGNLSVLFSAGRKKRSSQMKLFIMNLALAGG